MALPEHPGPAPSTGRTWRPRLALLEATRHKGALLMMLATTTLTNLGCSALAWKRSMIRRKFDRAGIQTVHHDLSAGRMRAFTGGDGDKTVLFIHGFGFGAMMNWENQLPAFKEASYRVLAPDLYWFGESRPHRDDQMLTVHEQADAVRELMQARGVARAHVVGLSFGGRVATELALRHPDRVDRLVLVDSVGPPATAAERRQVQRTFGTSEREHIAIPKNDAALRRLLQKSFYRRRWIPRIVRFELLKNEFWRFRKIRSRMLSHVHGEAAMPLERYQEIRAPALVVWGEADRLILPSLGRRIAAALPRGRFVAIPQAGHSPMLERPDCFNHVVLTYLASAPKTRESPHAQAPLRRPADGGQPADPDAGSSRNSARLPPGAEGS